MTVEMTKAFYVVMVSEDWYRLHVTSTHYCLGAGSDLKALLRTVERLTKKYRSEHKLLKGLSQMEDGGQVNDSTYVLYEKDYKDLHKYFDSKVETTVKKALEEVKFDTPYHRAMRKSALRTGTLITTQDTVTVEPVTRVIRKSHLRINSKNKH